MPQALIPASTNGFRPRYITLTVGGNVRVGGNGRYAVTISGDGDNTRVLAAGDLTLNGRLAVDVHGDLTPGTTLTIMSGDSIKGSFRGLAEGEVLSADGHRFRISYANDSVTLTVVAA